MSFLSARAAAVKPSATIAVTTKASEMKAAGKDVIGLGAGEPDFDTPDFIKEAAIAAIRQGRTKYTAVEGIPELRKAVCAKFKRENGIDYAPNEIIVGTGAKQIIYNALAATLNPGDEVVIPAPYWVSYPDMTLLAEGTPVVAPCSAKNNFKLRPEDLEKAITPKTKWLILNSPGNPTGVGYDREDLAALLKALDRHPHVHILSDDIYEHIRYDGYEFVAVLAVRPDYKNRVLTVNGVSKSYSMTGWRIGYAGGPAALIKEMAKLQSQSTSNACSISQYAALAALEGDQSFLKDARELFRVRRDETLAALAKIPGMTCVKPQGAFYLLPSCEAFLGKRTPAGALLKTDMDFVSYLLEDASVAAVPGAAFGADGFFRISYATSNDILREACGRIAASCAKLG
jgi:aspartate aminotransferase